MDMAGVLQDDSGQVYGIIEEKDATSEQKKIKLINAGIYCINKKFLQDAIPKIQSNNAQEEFYLTDIMAIGHKEKKKMGFMVAADYRPNSGCQQLSGFGRSGQDHEEANAEYLLTF